MTKEFGAFVFIEQIDRRIFFFRIKRVDIGRSLRLGLGCRASFGQKLNRRCRFLLQFANLASAVRPLACSIAGMAAGSP